MKPRIDEDDDSGYEIKIVDAENPSPRKNEEHEKKSAVYNNTNNNAVDLNTLNLEVIKEESKKESAPASI